MKKQPNRRHHWQAVGLMVLLAACSGQVQALGTDQPSPSMSFEPVVLATSVAPAERPTAAPTPRATPRPTVRPKLPLRPFYAPTVADAKAYALAKLGSTQFHCLDEIASHESGWDPTESYGRAYGIPQALPGSKMASAGADWRTNPVTQVRWMIGYVDGRYGSACGAWAFWQHHGWY